MKFARGRKFLVSTYGNINITECIQARNQDWLAEDPLCLGTNNQNLLVRFGFVERLTFIGYEFDIY